MFLCVFCIVVFVGFVDYFFVFFDYDLCFGEFCDVVLEKWCGEDYGGYVFREVGVEDGLVDDLVVGVLFCVGDV